MLLILSPAIPELLTGSTPYWLFINPFIMITLIVIYGFPALLYREYIVRNKLPYHKLLFLGLAQGILIEGIAVNTFYSTNTEKLGYFATYGRFYGINWPWAFYLTIFHSIWSVYTPIMLTEALFPQIRKSSLINLNHKKAFVFIALISIVTILFQFDKETYHPNPLYQLMSLILILIILRIGTIRTPLIKYLPKTSYPKRAVLLVLYPILFILLELFILAQFIPPILHILIGFLTYLLLYNLVSRLKFNDQYLLSIYLTIGLSINGILIALISHRYYIILSSLILSLVALIGYKKNISSINMLK